MAPNLVDYSCIESSSILNNNNFNKQNKIIIIIIIITIWVAARKVWANLMVYDVIKPGYN